MTSDRELLLVDLSARLLYRVIGLYTWKSNKSYHRELTGSLYDELNSSWNSTEDSQFLPYLRSMSSMTEEEKKELLCAIVGKDAVKYFQVLSDGSIDNTDAVYQDLHNFAMHWINFDGSNTTSYIDWLNTHHFDYRGLIEKGLALEAPEGMYEEEQQ